MKQRINNEKVDIIKNKLLSTGLTEDQAQALARDCMSLAYQKTKSTRVKSYEEYSAKYLGTLRLKVYNYLLNSPTDMSRQELANHTGERLSTICGRIWELKQDGLVVVCGTTKDPETNKTVELLRAIKLTNSI